MATHDTQRKIVMIHSTAGEFGGAEVYFVGARRLLREAGYDVYSFAFGDAPGGDDRDVVYGERASRTARKIGKFVFDPAVYGALRAFIDRVDPDLVHLHMDDKYPISVMLACRGRLILRTVHGPSFLCPSGWMVKQDSLEVCEGGAGLKCVKHGCISPTTLACYWPMQKASNALRRRYVSTFVAPSEQIKESLATHGFGPLRMMRYFVDTKTLDFKDGREGQVILFAGHLAPQKGLPSLLRAMPAILEKFPDATLVVAGRGPWQDEYMAEARQLGIENSVTFVGHVPNDQVGDLFHSASVFVMPSMWKEQFGIVGIEALGCGTPCVGSDIGGIPEWLLDGKHGFLIDPHDPADIADKTTRILADPERAREFARRGREFVVEHFDIEVHRRNLVALVGEVIERGRAGAG